MENIVVSSSLNNANYISTKRKHKKHSNVYIDKTPQDKLNRIYRSQGMLGKLFDKIQGGLGIGLNKSKLQQEINNTPAEQFDKKLNKYYDQQKNETEIAIDFCSNNL